MIDGERRAARTVGCALTAMAVGTVTALAGCALLWALRLLAEGLAALVTVAAGGACA